MRLIRWEDLPENMQTDAVRPYYDALQKKTGSLLLKRIFDIAVSFLMLLLLSPFFLILAIARIRKKGLRTSSIKKLTAMSKMRLSSKLPVFFCRAS